MSKRLSKSVDPKLKLQPQHIIDVLWALGNMRPGVAPTPLLVALGSYSEGQLVCFDVSMMCSLVVSYGQLKHPPESQLLAAVSAPIGAQIHWVVLWAVHWVVLWTWPHFVSSSISSLYHQLYYQTPIQDVLVVRWLAAGDARDWQENG